VWIPPPHEKYLKSVVIETTCGKKIDFGGLCIVETMAHIAQKSILPSVDHNDYPYKSASKVASYIYPAIGENDFFTFALCDACLMTTHPGEAYYHMLHLMKNENWQPEDEAHIYEFVFENIRMGEKTMLELFSEKTDLAIKQLTDYFTTPIFENERDWLRTVFNKANEIRRNQPDFMVKIIKKGSALTKEFADVLKELGTPLMMNLDRKCWFMPPEKLAKQKIQIDRFAAILEIYLLYVNGKQSCGLIEYCSQAYEGDITDKNCHDSPWERASKDQLCAFGALWKTWGLRGLEPIKKN
jgi:hypothetical protein